MIEGHSTGRERNSRAVGQPYIVIIYVSDRRSRPVIHYGDRCGTGVIVAMAVGCRQKDGICSAAVKGIRRDRQWCDGTAIIMTVCRIEDVSGRDDDLCIAGV